MARIRTLDDISTRKNRSSIVLIVLGILLFLIRYVGFIEFAGPGTQKMSLDTLSNLCNELGTISVTFLGATQACSLINGLSIGLIAVSVILILRGLSGRSLTRAGFTICIVVIVILSVLIMTIFVSPRLINSTQNLFKGDNNKCKQVVSSIIPDKFTLFAYTQDSDLFSVLSGVTWKDGQYLQGITGLRRGSRVGENVNYLYVSDYDYLLYQKNGCADYRKEVVYANGTVGSPIEIRYLFS